jgi:hypothetical protein
MVKTADSWESDDLGIDCRAVLRRSAAEIGKARSFRGRSDHENAQGELSTRDQKIAYTSPRTKACTTHPIAHTPIARHVLV